MRRKRDGGAEGIEDEKQLRSIRTGGVVKVYVVEMASVPKQPAACCVLAPAASHRLPQPL